MRTKIRTLALGAALLGLAPALAPRPAHAMVGGAIPAADGAGRAVVMVLGSHGTACTATAIAPDLLLTAAHCVVPGSEYKLVASKAGQPPVLKDISRIVRDPQFELKKLLGHVATADVALLKLAEQLPGKVAPAPLYDGTSPVAPGDAFIVAGYGVAVRGDGRTGGIVRAATLVATGQPGALQIRLVDPRTNDESPGLGACAGDSGAPVFRKTDKGLAIIGVVSWSTGPKLAAGCGGLTGVTPLKRYRAWIVETAGALSSPLAP